MHVYLQAICEMIKYIASLIRGDATCKNGKLQLCSWWWPLPIKTLVLGKDRGSVTFPAINLFKKSKNVLDSKNNNFYFL